MSFFSSIILQKIYHIILKISRKNHIYSYFSEIYWHLNNSSQVLFYNLIKVEKDASLF